MRVKALAMLQARAQANLDKQWDILGPRFAALQASIAEMKAAAAKQCKLLRPDEQVMPLLVSNASSCGLGFLPQAHWPDDSSQGPPSASLQSASAGSVLPCVSGQHALCPALDCPDVPATHQAAASLGVGPPSSEACASWLPCTLAPGKGRPLRGGTARAGGAAAGPVGAGARAARQGSGGPGAGAGREPGAPPGRGVLRPAPGRAGRAHAAGAAVLRGGLPAAAQPVPRVARPGGGLGCAPATQKLLGRAAGDMLTHWACIC